jgi:hypothetical protein
MPWSYRHLVKSGFKMPLPHFEPAMNLTIMGGTHAPKK